MPDPQSRHTTQKAPLPLWQAIVLIIIITFGLVLLFAVMVYLFTSGIQQLGLPLVVNIGVFVIISGIFAWLIKRLTDIISNMSHLWFSEEENDAKKGEPWHADQ